MDNTTIIFISSRETVLNQRLTNSKQNLHRHTQKLQYDLAQAARFDDSLQFVEVFLEEATQAISNDDANKSADLDTLKMKLEQLKLLLSQFSNNQSRLDTLNELGFRLSLDEIHAQNLKGLNQKWQKLMTGTSERYKEIQGLVLLHQSFNEKCDDWMAFLSQAEEDLAVDIAGNYDELLNQQISYDVSTGHHAVFKPIITILDLG